MKAKKIVMLIILAFNAPIHAQTVVGLYATPAVTYLRNTNSIGKLEPDSRIGASLGIQIQFKILHSLSLRSGVGYGFNHYSYRITGLFFSSNLNSPAYIEAANSNQEIQIPLLLQFNTHSNLFFAAGPEFIQAFNSTSDRTLYYPNGDVEKLSKEKLQYPFNYALTFSLGFGLPVGDYGLSVEPQIKAYQKSYMDWNMKQIHYGLKVSVNKGIN